MLHFRVRVDQGVMAIKVNSTPPKLQNWTLTIWLSCAIYGILVKGGFTSMWSLCRVYIISCSMSIFIYLGGKLLQNPLISVCWRSSTDIFPCFKCKNIYLFNSLYQSTFFSASQSIKIFFNCRYTRNDTNVIDIFFLSAAIAIVWLKS